MTDFGYCRVSRLDQDPELQFAALADAGVSPDHTYTDRISGTKDDRPGLSRVLAELEAGDRLTVWKLDRLGRSTSHLIQTVNELGERGVEFRSLTEALDTTTPSGRLVFTVLAAVAQFEREIMVERVNAGLAAARDRGTPLGRKTRVKPIQQQWIHKLAGEQYSHETIAAMTGLSRAAVGRVLRGEIASLPELADPDQDTAELPITGDDHDR